MGLKLVRNPNGTYTLYLCDGATVTGSYEFCHWVYNALWQKAVDACEDKF